MIAVGVGFLGRQRCQSQMKPCISISTTSTFKSASWAWLLAKTIKSRSLTSSTGARSFSNSASEDLMRISNRIGELAHIEGEVFSAQNPRPSGEIMFLLLSGARPATLVRISEILQSSHFDQVRGLSCDDSI